MFILSEFVRQNGFSQTRDSDKRDAFEKTYFHPLSNKTYTAHITIHYNAGYSDYNNCSVPLMEVDFKNEVETISVFNGIAPNKFDKAADLFEAIMPSIDFLKENYSG